MAVMDFGDTYVTVATSIAELDLRMNIPRRLIVKPQDPGLYIQRSVQGRADPVRTDFGDLGRFCPKFWPICPDRSSSLPKSPKNHKNRQIRMDRPQLRLC